jgi:hypothetical protein
VAQRRVDCRAPAGEQAAAVILARFLNSPALLDDLRTGMSMPGVCGIVPANPAATPHG